MDKGVIGVDIYNILAAPSYQYSVSMFDDDGEGTITPTTAHWFYVQPEGIMIQLPDEGDKKEVYLWKAKEEMDDKTRQVFNRIKTACNQYGYGFTIQDFGNGNLPKKFSHMAMRNREESKLDESMSGTPRRSFYKVNEAKLVIIHDKSIDENIRGSRTRNIKEMFIECGGERYRVPAYLPIGRALTYHIGSGGSIDDQVSMYLKNAYGDIRTLERISKAGTHSGNMGLSGKAKRYLNELKNNIRMVSRPMGYPVMCDCIREIPRVGVDRLKRHTSRYAAFPSLEGDDARVMSKYDILNSFANKDMYRGVINDIINDDRLARRAAAKVSGGDVVFSKPYELLLDSASDITQNVQRVAGDLSKLIECDVIDGVSINDVISHVLEVIAQSEVITPQQAKLVIELAGCATTSPVKQPPVIPELVDLNEWIIATTSKKLLDERK